MKENDNGHKLEIDLSKPVRDAMFDLLKLLDHSGPENQPYGAIVILCFCKDQENTDFYPYVMGDIDDQSITKLLISTLHTHECG